MAQHSQDFPHYTFVIGGIFGLCVSQICTFILLYMIWKCKKKTEKGLFERPSVCSQGSLKFAELQYLWFSDL